MIISNNAVLLKRILELRHALLSQNCPRQVITNGIERALNLNRSELRTVKQKSDENIVTFVSTFNPKNPELFPVIKQNFDILLEDEIMRDILSNYDIIKSTRKTFKAKQLTLSSSSRSLQN